MGERRLLFSIGKKDLVRQTFCTGGNGGQHRNATQNGVRLTHPPSGAVGEGRVYREQYRNERLALVALAGSEQFKSWHRAECARRMGIARTSDGVDHEVMARVDMLIEQGLRDGSIQVEGE